jgi:hypothetical protein
MYPGEDKLHPDQDRGIGGPINSVQLANLRRGLQDHLYLTFARQLGLTSLINNELKAIVPRVFSDAKGTVGFAETGNQYERARYALGRAIVIAQHKIRKSNPPGRRRMTAPNSPSVTPLSGKENTQ